MEIISTYILILFILDPFGNMPFTLAILKDLEKERFQKTILREIAIAYGILVFFLFSGEYVFGLLNITKEALFISGGIILFLVALKMIFSSSDRIFEGPMENSRLLVPIAMPALAGPASIATVSILSAQNGVSDLGNFLALTLAMASVGCILFFGAKLKSAIGEKGVIALERLTGMILIVLAVQMMLNGIKLAFPAA